MHHGEGMFILFLARLVVEVPMCALCLYFLFLGALDDPKRGKL
jgi:hypothetical protein